MKTLKLSLTIFFTFLYVSLNAQVFVGGNLGFSLAGGSINNGSTTTDKSSAFNLSLSPFAGKFFTEDVAGGVAINFAYSRDKTPGTPETVNTSSTIGVAPFIRYYALRMDKFSIFGQGNLGFSYSSSKSKSDGVSTDGPGTKVLSINIFPNVAYDLSSRLALETSINVLNIGYSYTSTKNGNVKDRTSSFSFGGGLRNIVNIGSITIGAIYKF